MNPCKLFLKGIPENLCAATVEALIRLNMGVAQEDGRIESVLAADGEPTATLFAASRHDADKLLQRIRSWVAPRVEVDRPKRVDTTLHDAGMQTSLKVEAASSSSAKEEAGPSKPDKASTVATSPRKRASALEVNIAQKEGEWAWGAGQGQETPASSWGTA